MGGQQKRKLVPIEVIVGLALIGLVLVGSVLYARAVRFQRFMEPMLAVLEPRSNFSDKLRSLILEEFDNDSLANMKLTGNTLRIRKSMLAMEGGHVVGLKTYNRLGKVFLRVLEDPGMRSNLDFILISVNVPFSKEEGANYLRRGEATKEAELILATVLSTSPELRLKYAPMISSSAFSVAPASGQEDWVTVHIEPSERLHTEVLKRLEKYAY